MSEANGAGGSHGAVAGETRHDLVVGSGADERRIAVRVGGGLGPTLLWLGGFRSDMTGSKAEALAAHAAARGRRVVRFDYSGHGVSGGAFANGTIGRWLEEAEAVVAAHAPGPLVLVGSSMGGWIALLLARALAGSRTADRIVGLVLVAPAPDFTEALMWPNFTPEMQAELMQTGVVLRPSDYGAPYPITRALIEDGRRHLVLGGPIDIAAPVRILQGCADADVPWRHAMALAECLPFGDVVVTLVKDGDHRLSRPEDLARLLAAVDELAS
ncbi:alpha/beta fold hydrolase [Methylobrevis albus]|uniref:Alpha/beta hydrolase n=1 Tax=Methylobrevis albus TaxID=2793297 RepID=A0A931HYZ2_9HYPH|nr:alpha/beta hydrolase [Methylobrevis albus]MBH0236249.1 alpha/beta hydrolase [Methylobrevis albus]